MPGKPTANITKTTIDGEACLMYSIDRHNEYAPYGGIMSVDDALALADAIYLAAGRLPRVEDEWAYKTLQAMRRPPHTISGFMDAGTKDAITALHRLETYGLVAQEETRESFYYSHWSLTDKGKEFVESSK
ncbi:MAG: hypothetical protein ACOYD4_06755 [Solirubrobacterales bacterium]